MRVQRRGDGLLFVFATGLRGIALENPGTDGKTRGQTGKPGDRRKTRGQERVKKSVFSSFRA
jgi:hypothetical protein